MLFRSGADGKTYYVDSKLNYKDWKKTYVDGGSKDRLEEIEPDNIMKDKPKTFEEKIQAVKEKVADNGGIVTEEHLHEAGKVIQEELAGKRINTKIELDNVQNELHSLKLIELRDEKHKLASVQRGLRKASDIGMTDEQVGIRYLEVVNKLNELAPKENELIQRIFKVESSYKGSFQNNVDELTETIARFRKVGNNKLDVNSHLNNSRSPMKAVVVDAYHHYPTDWIEKSVANGKLTPKKANRGYYNSSEIAISGSNNNSCKETAIHELGHRFEKVVPGILQAEKAFYDRRTIGEPLQWLGSGYRRDEKSKFDKFLNKYMGKNYHGTAYELVSMGFQYAYTKPTILWQDIDMANWIYGILALF